jgi:uncharacterized membrane protein
MSDAQGVPAPQPSSQDNDKVMAAVATIPLVGLIMYYGMKDLSPLAKFYAKQSIGLLIVSILVSVVSLVLGFIPFLGIITCFSPLLSLALLVAWIILVVKALQGEEYRLPVLADMVDQLVK